MTDETDWAGYPRDDCYFCRDDCDVLETHHIVPRRHGGGNEDYNLVVLCPTCHEKLERLYDKRFYQAIGVGEPADVVDYVTDFLITELNEVEIDMRKRFNSARSRLEATHLDGDEMEYSLSEHVHDAIQEYHAEETPDTSNREKIKIVRSIIERLEDEYEDGAKYKAVRNASLQDGLSGDEFDKTINKLKSLGEAYEPSEGYLRTT